MRLILFRVACSEIEGPIQLKKTSRAMSKVIFTLFMTAAVFSLQASSLPHLPGALKLGNHMPKFLAVVGEIGGEAKSNGVVLFIGSKINSVKQLAHAVVVSPIRAITSPFLTFLAPVFNAITVIFSPFITVMEVLGTVFGPVMGVVRTILTPIISLFAFFSLITHLNRIQKVLGTGIAYMRQPTNGLTRCNLCDQIVYLILTMEDVDVDDVDCDDICPFKLAACLDICAKLAGALASAQEYPCEALKFCPKQPPVVNGKEQEIICEVEVRRWYEGGFGCNPEEHCALSFSDNGDPKCIRARKKLLSNDSYMKKLALKAGRLTDAVFKKRYCNELTKEEVANKVMCVDAPTGYALWADYAYYILVFVIAFGLSIHAVETPGLDDDRHWLVFWIMNMLLSTVESFTAVMLSRYPAYYFIKFLLIFWLLVWGADWLYDRIREVTVFVFNLFFPSLKHHATNAEKWQAVMSKVVR